MRKYGGALSNENVLSNMAELLALNTPAAAFKLIGGNLFGLWAASVLDDFNLFFFADAVRGSVPVSMLYHACQTQTACFNVPFVVWTSIDHFSATFMAGLFVVSNILVKQENEEDEKEEEGEKVDNMIHNKASCRAAYRLGLATVITVYVHPFSYSAFVDVFTIAILIIFHFVLITCKGKLTNMKRRMRNWKDLIVGIILATIGLMCYVSDSFIGYEWLHSFWHAFVYPGLPYLASGTMGGVKGVYSIVDRQCLVVRKLATWFSSCYATTQKKKRIIK